MLPRAWQVPVSAGKRLANTINQAMEHWSYDVITLLLTFYVLFINDVRQLIPNPAVDTPLFISMFVVFGLFAIEWLILSVVRKGYFLHFFFWLDLISTVSILLDIDWITDTFMTTGKGKSVSYAAIIRATRASRVGSRIGRIIRIMRLIRLLRVIKVYRMTEKKQTKNQMSLIAAKRKTKGRVSDERKSLIQSDKELGALLGRLSPGETIQGRLSKFASPADLLRSGIESELAGGVRKSSLFRPSIAGRHTAGGSGLKIRNDVGQGGKGVLEGEHEYQSLNPSPYSPKEGPLLELSTLSVDAQLQHAMRESRKASAGGSRHDHLPEGKLSAFRPSIALSSPQNLEASSRKRDSISGWEGDIGVGYSALDFGAEGVEEGELDAEKFNDHIFEETNVGKKLSDSTTKRVVIIVVVLMISIPIFSMDTYLTPYDKYQFGLDEMYATLSASPQLGPTFRAQWDGYKDMLNEDAISIVSLELSWFDGSATSNVVTGYYNMTDTIFRESELGSYTATSARTTNDFYLTARLDYRFNQYISSILSIVRTIFLCFLFCAASLVFTHEATNLVLEPIENMLKKIHNITQNPLSAVIMDEEEAYFLERMRADTKAKMKKRDDGNSETGILVSIITRIGALLAVGFGEAGSEIIVQNMESGGAINPMIPGRKVMAVFGFCDIRNFTDATEVLQENVMMFVNDIAEIVHSKVDVYGGRANKNIGDAFLLVWKIHDDCDEAERLLAGPPTQISEQIETRRRVCAELSVFAFVQIIIELNRNRTLSYYNNHPALQERIRHFRVRMGFGLHLGWAIEGAIGSEFKIDASYLSPNVNMASRLEAATKQFGVSLLVSDRVFDCLSLGVAAYLRCIDVVTVKGSEAPVSLYTFDGHFDAVSMSTAPLPAKFVGIEKKSHKYKQRLAKGMFLESIFEEKVLVSDLIDQNPLIKLVREKYTHYFYEAWKVGFQDYLDGRWKEALSCFVDCLKIIDDDGPTKSLIDVIRASNGQAPPGWKGVRPLAEK